MSLHGRDFEDDDLRRVLSDALSRGVARPVDTTRLLVGAQSRARRIRRRRAVVASALGVVVVGGLPLGLAKSGVLERLSGSSRVSAGPSFPASSNLSGAASSPTAWVDASSSAQQPAPTPELSTTPAGDASSAVTSTMATATPSDVGTDTAPSGTLESTYVLQRTDKGLIVVPDAAMLGGDELKAVTLIKSVDTGQYLRVTTTSTAICSAEPTGLDAAIGGRLISFLQRPDNSDQWSVSESVRVFRGEGARESLDWLRRNVGSCKGILELTQVPTDTVPGDGAVLAYQVGLPPLFPASLHVIGAVRAGRTTAGIELVVPASAATDAAARLDLALNQGRRLLALARDRLVASGFAPQAQAQLN